MSVKCRYCGAELEGYEVFCPACGRSLEEEPAQADLFMEEQAADAPAKGAEPLSRTPAKQAAPRRAAPAGPAAKRPSGAAKRTPRRGAPARGGSRAPSPEAMNPRARALLLAALSVAAVLLILLGVRMLTRERSTEPVYDFTPVVDAYFESVRLGNADQFISTRPPEYVAYLTTGSGGAFPNAAVYRSETAAILQARLEKYESQLGEVRSIRYHLTDAVSYIHRCAALSGVLKSWYGFRENSVEDAVIVNGTYTVQGKKASAEYDIKNLLLIKIGGKWYFSPDAGSYWKGE